MTIVSQFLCIHHYIFRTIVFIPSNWNTIIYAPLSNIGFSCISLSYLTFVMPSFFVLLLVLPAELLVWFI